MSSDGERHKPHPADLIEKSSFEERESVVELRDSASDSSHRTRTVDVNTKLENPLAKLVHKQLLADAADFARSHELGEYTETIQKGALLAQDPAAFETLPMLTEEDRRMLRREYTHKWDQPKTLYYLVVVCAIAAAVQGVRTLMLLVRRPCTHDCLGLDGRSGDQRGEPLLSRPVRDRASLRKRCDQGAVAYRARQFVAIGTSFAVHELSY